MIKWSRGSTTTGERGQCAMDFPVVLNGTGNLKKAIPFLSKHTKIYAYLDNDKSGKEAVQKLQNLKLPVTDCSNMYAGHNDLNDFLQQMIRQKPAQIIPKTRRMKL